MVVRGAHQNAAPREQHYTVLTQELQEGGGGGRPGPREAGEARTQEAQAALHQADVDRLQHLDDAQRGAQRHHAAQQVRPEQRVQVLGQSRVRVEAVLRNRSGRLVAIVGSTNVSTYPCSIQVPSKQRRVFIHMNNVSC